MIRMLEGIKGNPEIVVWNGFVEDVQHINKELVPIELHKLTFEGYKERVNLERQLRDKLEPLPDEELADFYKRHSIGQWECFTYYPPDKGDRAYKAKTVYVIEPKSSGKRHLIDLVRFAID